MSEFFADRVALLPHVYGPHYALEIEPLVPMHSRAFMYFQPTYGVFSQGLIINKYLADRLARTKGKNVKVLNIVLLGKRNNGTFKIGKMKVGGITTHYPNSPFMQICVGCLRQHLSVSDPWPSTPPYLRLTVHGKKGICSLPKMASGPTGSSSP